MLSPAHAIPKNWSSTLILPKSTFPPRALVADRSKYLNRCTDDLYGWQRTQRAARPTFTLHDGPPYANGHLHVGHALNKILKDIVCRYKLSQGYRVDYVPGWDCHGLPIELKALEQHDGRDAGTNDRRLDAVSIRQAARKVAASTVEEQKIAFREWGIMADWKNAWTTMDRGYEVKQLNVFKTLVWKGLIYRKFKPVYWSPSSHTALAEAELEYKEDHVSTAAYVKFPLTNFPLADIVSGNRTINAVIWTTNPWTLPANKAIGVHSDLDYLLVASVTHGLLLIAAPRLDDIQKVCKEALEVITTIRGAQLVGAAYSDPAFTQETRPLLHADFVSSDSGSGLVHFAPGHGMDEYLLCLRHGIRAFAPLDDKGHFTSNASPGAPELLLGKEVLKSGNRAVIDYLDQRQLLLASHKYKHKYPYDWRSKQPVIVRATEQWFANVGDVREAALESLDSVRFIPRSGKDRLRSFVKNRSEWCISRQRAWGVPIPALYHKETGEAILTEESISHITTVVEERGIDAWWTDGETDPTWTPPSLRNSRGQSAYVRGKDTMDVWFDSGTSWTQIETLQSSGGAAAADVYLEGSDQHRGWFQSSLLTRVAQAGLFSKGGKVQAPFKTLITHGFTLDQHSRKMSKSIGNVISPDEIMAGTLLPPMKRRVKKGTETSATEQQPLYDAMGPDALRLWVASCDYTNDAIISQTILKAINGTLSKYRVTFKLLLGMLDGFEPPASKVSSDQLDNVHQIALMQLNKTSEDVLQYYDAFEFNRAVQEINRYVNTDLSAFYVESIKDTIYADSGTSKNRLQAQLTLFEIYSRLQTLLYPVTPLLVEETWDYAPDQIKRSYLHPAKRTFASEGSFILSKQNRQLEYDITFLLRANTAVKSAQELARADKKMGSSLQSQVIFKAPRFKNEVGERPAFEFLQRYKADLETILVVSAVDVYEGPLPGFVAEAAWSYQVEVSLAGSLIPVHVYAPQKAKCIRCWKYNAPVSIECTAALCFRCSEVVEDLRTQKPELFEKEGQDGGTVAAVV